jgi:hypothetical protein
MIKQPFHESLHEMFALIGKLASHLGAYEYCLLAMIVHLSREPALVEIARKMTVDKRAALLKRIFVTRSLFPELQDEYDSIRKEAERLAEQRAICVHNFVVLDIPLDPNGPLVATILKTRNMFGFGQAETTSHTMEQVRASAIAAEVLDQRVSPFTRKVCGNEAPLDDSDLLFTDQGPSDSD